MAVRANRGGGGVIRLTLEELQTIAANEVKRRLELLYADEPIDEIERLALKVCNDLSDEYRYISHYEVAAEVRERVRRWKQ